MANKVRFGLSNVYFSKRTVSDSTVTYATPVAHEGAISLSITRSSDKNTLYADNKAFFTVYNKSSREGELEIALIQDFVKTNYLGYKTDTNSHLVETDEQGAAFALLFQVEGDESNKKYCIYNVTAAETDSEYTTREENTEPATSTLALTMAGETVGSTQVYIAEVDSFASVTIPTFTSI